MISGPASPHQPAPAQPKRSAIPGLAAALAVCALAFVAGAEPPPSLTVAEWAQDYRVVSAESGSPFPGRWSNSLAPYAVEPMECLTLTHPSREVVFKKSAQTAFSECGINLIGYTADRNPAPILVVLPSDNEAKRYVKLKLDPTIRETPCLARVVAETKSRDADSSTASLKRFRGGYVVITSASSSKGLQMLSARVLILEEVSEYPLDVAGRGDPVDLALERAVAWTGREKVAYISTPGIKGACRITVKYEASDQRRYYVPCPHCGALQPLAWEHLVKTAPEAAAYVCQAHGCVIEHEHKRAMVAAGVWLRCYPGPKDGSNPPPPPWIAREDVERYRARPDGGRQPGFAVNGLYSPFLAWSDIVRKWKAAEGQPAKEKVFSQQVLGEAWEETGEAPEWKLLHARREDYAPGTLPAGAIWITLGADVQKDGIYYEVTGWGNGKTSWSLDAGFLDGETGDHQTGAWRKLSETAARLFEDPNGRRWQIDRIAVDSGYNTHAVYAWVRLHHNALAVDGRAGWRAPPLGLPVKVDVTRGGKKIRRGMKIWPVGTWTLKGELYANLRKEPPKPGTEHYPIGYCHFGNHNSEAYFQQLTAEYLSVTERQGRQVQSWKASGPNHWHDCRIYAMAAAEHLGISRMRPADWEQLAAMRQLTIEPQRDLVAMIDQALSAPKAPAPSPAPQAERPIAPAPPAPQAARPLRLRGQRFRGRFGV